MPLRTFPWPRIEALLASDPAGRGLAHAFADALPGDGSRIERAARQLAGARAVGIATGFCILLDDRVTAETDGPTGSVALAHVLAELGIEVTLFTDAIGRPLLEAACDFAGLPRTMIVAGPLESAHQEPPSHSPLHSPLDLIRPPQRSASKDDFERRATPAADEFAHDFFASDAGRRLTHLVAIERAGPSHTRMSFLNQRRTGPPPVEAFERTLPACERDACHNMRGLLIDAHTARLDRLFDLVRSRALFVETIAVGDGGNEIGCGEVAWERFAAEIPNESGGRIACRVEVDTLIPAGVSNWGGYALAYALAALRGQRDLLDFWDASREQRLVQALVQEAGAVDGVTKRPTPTVDGLEFEEYFAAPAAIRQLLSELA